MPRAWRVSSACEVVFRHACTVAEPALRRDGRKRACGTLVATPRGRPSSATLGAPVARETPNMNLRSPSVESAAADPMRSFAHAHGPLSRSPAALHAVMGIVACWQAFPLRSRFVQRVLRSVREVSLRAGASARRQEPVRRGVDSMRALVVRGAGPRPCFSASERHRGSSAHSQCRVLGVRHHPAKFLFAMPAPSPNKRFEATAASALAVPLSLRSAAAPQARR